MTHVWLEADRWRLILTLSYPYVTITYILNHDDVIKWKHFPRYWPFVQGIHRSPVNSPHKDQRSGALMFSMIYAWIYSWAKNGEAVDLRRYPLGRHCNVNIYISVLLNFTSLLDIDFFNLCLTKSNRWYNPLTFNISFFSYHEGNTCISGIRVHWNTYEWSGVRFLLCSPEKYGDTHINIAWWRPVPGEFTAQKASNAENVCIWWRHHEMYRVVPKWIEHITTNVSNGYEINWIYRHNRQITKKHGHISKETLYMYFEAIRKYRHNRQITKNMGIFQKKHYTCTLKQSVNIFIIVYTANTVIVPLFSAHTILQ